MAIAPSYGSCGYLASVIGMVSLRWLRSFDLWFFLFAGFLIVKGLINRDSSFLIAESGTGYILGIVGASMMLLLLLYPVRKHARFFRNLGPIKYWFRIHMLLGVAGPVLILYHANFGLGSTNSNIALICMLIVAGSGLFGRLFYSKIHDGLYGRKIELADLRNSLEEIKSQFADSETLHQTLINFEKTALKHRWLLLAVINIIVGRLRSAVVKRKAAVMMKQVNAGANDVLANRLSLQKVNQYFRQVIRVADFTVYERLFSLWHVLHIPLFIMMVISGIVHVFAVHIY